MANTVDPCISRLCRLPKSLQNQLVAATELSSPAVAVVMANHATNATCFTYPNI